MPAKYKTLEMAGFRGSASWWWLENKVARALVVRNFNHDLHLIRAHPASRSPSSLPNAMEPRRREVFMNVPAHRGGPEMSFEVHGNVAVSQTGSAECDRARPRRSAYATT